MGKVKDTILKLLIYFSVFVTAGVLLLIIGYILWNGFGALNFKFFTDLTPSIVSTLMIIFLSVLITVPIGLCTAIYLTEYAKKKKVVAFINFTIDSLAGIPSILYGFFGLVFFVTILNFKWSLLSGCLTLAIMILPVIVRVTQESLRSVPISFREGSYALGATKVSTIGRIVIPTAMKGIITAAILAIGRIVGETAAVFLTAGTVDRMPGGFLDLGRTLSVHLYLLAKEAVGENAFQDAFGTATVLIIIVLILVLATQLIFKEKKD